MTLDPQHLRRRVLPSILLVGVASLLGYILRDAPREQEIELLLHGSRDRLLSLDLSAIGSEEEELVTTRWSWDQGQAPPQIRTTLRLSPGHYQLHIHLKTPPNTALIKRNILFQGEPIQVSLQVE